MADILSDIYPVPVSFVDGQQPTARFLNAWAAQIDVAFAILARIIGDFDGESSNQATYISNLVRTIGVMGWLDSRLPRGLCAGLVDGHDPDLNPDGIFPTLVESLSIGTKEALLTFLPRANPTTIDAGTISGWTKVNIGNSINPGSNFTAVNQWTNWSRKVYATTAIPAGAQIQYEVDTDHGSANTQDYYDAYGPDTGPNVIPNMYEIAHVTASGGSFTDLCTYEEVDGMLWLEFPKIRRAMNPSKPFGLATNDALDLIDGSVQWLDSGHTPRYTVPAYIFNLALGENEDQIPEGLCSLWIAGAEKTTRLVNQNSEEQIRFFVDQGDKRHIRIELPDGFVLPHTLEGAEEGLDERYIVAFASVGLADALLHERARMIKHAHDGTGDDGVIRAVSLSERFNSSHYTQSIVLHNHFPQYLLRTGYNSDSDVLNDDSAFMGDLLITRSDKIPGDGGDPNANFLELESFSLYFGSTAGPRLFFDGTDTTGYDSSVGKFVLKDAASIFPIRLRTPDLFLGTETTGLQFHWSAANDVLTLSDANESTLTPDGIGLRFGTMIIADGKISFEDAETVDSLVPATMTFAMDDTTPAWTLAQGGEVWDPRTRLVVGEVYTDGIVNHNSNATLTKWIGPEGWTSAWAEGSGPPTHQNDGVTDISPWVYQTGFGADTIGGQTFLTETPPHLKGVGADGGQVTSRIKALRKVIDLDPLVSAAAIEPNSGLVLKNIKFILSSGDNSLINSDHYYKAYVRRCRVFNGDSFVFDTTTETVFTSPNVGVSTVGPGHFTIDLLAADSSHQFNFKEYMYTIELVSVDDYDNSNAVDFDFYGCQLVLTADFIG